MAIQIPLFSQTSDTTVSNTTTETSILGSGVGTKSISANTLSAGRVVRLTMGGDLETALLAPTLRIRVKLGGEVLLDTTAASLLSVTSSKKFWLDALISVRGSGSAAPVIGSGLFLYNSALTNGVSLNLDGVEEEINTTQANVLDVTAQWGTASENNIITSQTAFIELLAP